MKQLKWKAVDDSVKGDVVCKKKKKKLNRAMQETAAC